MTATEIRNIIEEEEFDVYGLRMDYAEYEPGDTCEDSFEWWQDDPEDGSKYIDEMGLWMGEKLDGTCAIKVTANNIDVALKRIKMYNPGANLYLLGGYDWEEGNDVDEIVIRNAKVIM